MCSVSVSSLVLLEVSRVPAGRTVQCCELPLRPPGSVHNSTQLGRCTGSRGKCFMVLLIKIKSLTGGTEAVLIIIVAGPKVIPAAAGELL